MKEQILKLREQGKSYNQIKFELGCSKGTISYHCGEGQKEKNKNRTKNLRKKSVISQKVESFQTDRKLRDKSEDFQRERIVLKNKKHGLGKRKLTFRWQDVIEKFGWETTCYLTGEKINLREPKTYQFDHKVPYSKGGDSTIDNLGIALRMVNVAKSNMLIEEFFELCKKVLEFNGYEVRKVNHTVLI